MENAEITIPIAAPRRDQQPVRRRERAKESPRRKPGVQPQQRRLPVKSVQEETGDDAGDSGTERVGRDDQPELSRRNVKDPDVLRPERHDDDEVEDSGELDRRQQQQQRPFIANGQHRGGGWLGKIHRGRVPYPNSVAMRDAPVLFRLLSRGLYARAFRAPISRVGRDAVAVCGNGAATGIGVVLGVLN